MHVRIIKNIFDSQRKHFEENGPLRKLGPLFDATETFFFIPGDVTQKGPNVRDSIDLKRFMSFVLAAIIPTLLWGIYNTGYHSLLASGVEITIIKSIIRGLYIVMPIVAVSYGVGFFWEIVFAVKRKHAISEGFLVTGILFPLTLPPTIPLWQVAMGISFGVVLGKEIFGGTGRNFLNPALTGRAFLFFAYPSKMSGDTVWTFADKVDALTGATPLAISGLVEAGGKIESALTSAKYSFATLFEGLYPGSIGETSALLCMVGAVFLVVTGIANYRIIAGGIIGVLATGFFLDFISGSNSLAWFSLNPFYHLVIGGFAFGITYMATDPVSAPGMDTSRWIYGFLIGVLTVLVRVFNPAYVEGTMLSILFMNALAPVIDHFVIGIRLGKRVPNV
jgi:Na+-transporting NADH:ubiquinone oxidoreductase subunit B